jgi:prevent-host-death family protein
MAMTTLPLATVKNTLSAVVDQVEGTHERVVITRRGVPAAVLISPADLAALEETLDVLSDPDTMERLRRSREDVARGDVLDAEQLRTLLEAPGR